ncbi:Sugar phosphate isomerase/epimerase [Chromohalobacter canadensis]|uniref:Sugar phosphate isomerase/epimerase n=1 Tax=Chromohalobacter canadensis TaxID=141389 RepID=A0A285VR00_9GAMM|nr:sugar phosphate isomerase/epimerase [Chromohalobacter canadensis]SOC56504.1 Sugar phosphate isomerase/epimerase [Chromohalobacter canadensis]
MSAPELLAAYFTISGDVYPFGSNEVSPFLFEHRVEAAARAGYKGIGLVHPDLMATKDRLGYAEMNRIMAANGIKHIEFEFLAGWYKSGAERRASDVMRSELFEAAEALNARAVKVAPGLDETEAQADVPRMVDCFGELAIEAAQYGTALTLEIMPFSNVRSIDMARRIVEGAGQANGGLLIDIWHLARSGINYSDIAQIDPRYIGGVELNDADRYPIQPLWLDTIHRRRLPGEGALDVQAFVKAVQATGFKGPWGVEILSESHRRMPLDEMAHRSFDTSAAQFA